MVGFEKEEKNKEKLLKMAEVSVIIDDYDDIFSDFDPRPFEVRAISDDLLLEAKKACRAKPSGQIEMVFLIPSAVRDDTLENVVRKRIREYFRKHYLLMLDEVAKVKRNGILLALLGIVLLIVATYTSFLEETNVLFKFLRILLEPAGWFSAWTGLDQFYYTIREKKPDMDFYERMSNAEIIFISH